MTTPQTEEDIEQLREDSAMLQWLITHVTGPVTVETASGPDFVVRQNVHISRASIRWAMQNKP